MTTPISGSMSGGSCSRAEDDLDTPNASSSSSSASASKPTSESRAPQSNASSSSLDVDWDSVPSAGPSPALAAASPQKAAEGHASTNASRTTQRDIHDGPHSAAGYTDDKKSVFVSAAAVKGSYSDGVEIELGSASVQIGRQHEAQIGAGRAGYHGEIISVAAEAFTASAQVGVENPDGSTGMNAGLSATAASIEATAKHSGNSITAGLSLGAGASGSIGLRDDDRDGKPEACVRASFEFVIVGGCIELPAFFKP